MTARDSTLSKFRAIGTSTSSAAAEVVKACRGDKISLTNGVRKLSDRLQASRGDQLDDALSKELRERPASGKAPDSTSRVPTLVAAHPESEAGVDLIGKPLTGGDAGPSEEGINPERHNNADSGSLLPTAVIVGGLATLCILAVVTTGPTDSEDASALPAVALADEPAAANPAQAQALLTALPEVSKAQDLSEGESQAKPIQLAAAVSPVIFESSAQPIERRETGNVVRFSDTAEPTVRAVDVAPSQKQPETAAVTKALIVQSPATTTTAEPAPADQKTVEELQMLKGENERLKEMMAELENETLSLNSELLQLELSLAEVSDQAEEPQTVVETRTVYNFVNVPLGADVQADNSAQYNQPESAQVYMNDQYRSDNQYPVNNAYPVDNQYPVNNQLPPPPQLIADPATIAELPAPEMGWQAGGQVMPPPNDVGLYHNGAYLNGAVDDPYIDQSAYIVESETQLYGSGADVQYGPAQPPLDLRGYPPVN
jgi:hypothetical protein